MDDHVLPLDATLYERAAREIDTSWRHSEHWPKTEFGSMTEEGWKRALRDCRSEAEYAEARAGRLRALEKVLIARVGEKFLDAVELAGKVR